MDDVLVMVDVLRDQITGNSFSSGGFFGPRNGGQSFADISATVSGNTLTGIIVFSYRTDEGTGELIPNNYIEFTLTRVV